MGRRTVSTFDQRNIYTIGMLTAGTMNKQIVRHFQASERGISSLRTKIREMGSFKNRNHVDRPRKTTRREDIDNVTPFRRYRCISSARIPGLLSFVKGTRICAKTVQRRRCGARLC